MISGVLVELDQSTDVLYLYLDEITLSWMIVFLLTLRCCSPVQLQCAQRPPLRLLHKDLQTAACRWNMKTWPLLPHFLRFYSLSCQSSAHTGAIGTRLQHGMVGHTRRCFYDFWSIISSPCITRGKTLAACQHDFKEQTHSLTQREACRGGCVWGSHMHACMQQCCQITTTECLPATNQILPPFTSSSFGCCLQGSPQRIVCLHLALSVAFLYRHTNQLHVLLTSAFISPAIFAVWS